MSIISFRMMSSNCYLWFVMVRYSKLHFQLGFWPRVTTSITSNLFRRVECERDLPIYRLAGIVRIPGIIQFDLTVFEAHSAVTLLLQHLWILSSLAHDFLHWSSTTEHNSVTTKHWRLLILRSVQMVQKLPEGITVPVLVGRDSGSAISRADGIELAGDDEQQPNRVSQSVRCCHH